MRFFKISMEKPGDSAMGDSLSDFNGLRETRRINEHSLPLSDSPSGTINAETLGDRYRFVVVKYLYL